MDSGNNSAETLCFGTREVIRKTVLRMGGKWNWLKIVSISRTLNTSVKSDVLLLGTTFIS